MNQRVFCSSFLLLLARVVMGGTLTGHVRDLNWYTQYQTNPFGVGYYEFAVNANATNNSSLGGFAATDVFGVFSMPSLPAGSYTVASWDVWWRSAYAFNVVVPATGTSADVDLRLKATMWGYPAFWDSRGYYEFGQTFGASGPVTMIYLRDPLNTSLQRRVGEDRVEFGDEVEGVTVDFADVEPLHPRHGEQLVAQIDTENVGA